MVPVIDAQPAARYSLPAPRFTLYYETFMNKRRAAMSHARRMPAVPLRVHSARVAVCPRHVLLIRQARKMFAAQVGKRCAPCKARRVRRKGVRQR